MGNDQNKLKEAAPPPRSVNLRGSPSPSLPHSKSSPTAERLKHGFAANIASIEPGKKILTKEDFVNFIFSAIPDVGEALNDYMSCLQSAENSTTAVDEAVYVKGGTCILEFSSDSDQLQFYAHLFAKGEDVIMSSDVLTLFSVSQQATWLSAGINVPPTEASRKVVEAALKNLFKDSPNVSVAEFCGWSQKICRTFTSSLHAYVISCLLGIKHSTLVRSLVPWDLQLDTHMTQPFNHMPPSLTGNGELYTCPRCLQVNTIGSTRFWVRSFDVWNIAASFSQDERDFSCDLVMKCRDGNSLVSLSSLWLLTFLLPPKYFPVTMSSSNLMPSSIAAKITENNTWHVLYNSNSHGLSVNRFQHHVLDYVGPTLVLVSFDQHVYAAAVDVQWMDSVKRWGGDDAMFFEIQPTYRLIQGGSGLIYLNLSDRTAPKGLHFGKDARTTFLKIDEELSKVSHYGVTFKLNAIEVWGCGGQECLDRLRKQKQWDHKEVTKNQNRKLLPDDWKDNPDRLILEMGGVTTDHAQRGDI